MEEKILVTRSSMPEIDEFVDEIKSIWENHWMTNMGEKHRRLEEGLKDYLKVKNISLFVNGHMALELALQAFNLSGEVITTPFTFASTTHAIVRNGLRPVFCDIDPKDYTIDVKKIEEKITDKTTAIVPVHVYGNICNIEEIQAIADKYNLKVIYDAAHAFGETYKGVGIGNFGDASMFSFHATKVYNTIEGGAVCFKSDSLQKKLYELKNFGIKDEETVDNIGVNAKMNEFQAAMGLCNLRHVNEDIKKRKTVYNEYQKFLKNIEGIKVPQEKKSVKSNYAYYPIEIDEKIWGETRDDIYERLKRYNIFSRKYFYPLTNMFSCFKDEYDVSETPVALKVSKRILTLPMFSELEIDDISRICEIIVAKKGEK